MSFKTFKVNKIARDNDVSNMLADSMQVQTKSLHSHDETIAYFKAKLIEEAEEVVMSEDRSEVLEELADCLEVIHGYANALGVSFDSINKIREQKKQKRGGFMTSTVIETITLPEDHHDIERFIKQADKYPQVLEECEAC